MTHSYDMTYVYTRRDLCTLLLDAMGLLRSVGASKLQVSFAEFSLFNRALLQKRPIILRSLQVVATPYVEQVRDMCVWGGYD